MRGKNKIVTQRFPKLVCQKCNYCFDLNFDPRAHRRVVDQRGKLKYIIRTGFAELLKVRCPICGAAHADSLTSEDLFQCQTCISL